MKTISHKTEEIEAKAEFTTADHQKMALKPVFSLGLFEGVSLFTGLDYWTNLFATKNHFYAL